jgi:hypothetical protein
MQAVRAKQVFGIASRILGHLASACYRPNEEAVCNQAPWLPPCTPDFKSPEMVDEKGVRLLRVFKITKTGLNRGVDQSLTHRRRH